jgi:hypothetical protein
MPGWCGRVSTGAMSAVRTVPVELLHRPFTRSEALAAGITSRMLQGRRFVRLHPAVYRHADHVLSRQDVLEAARLAMPPDARLTGISRLQALGLDHGPPGPVHFVVEGDLHLVTAGVFLHRTALMPPADARDVSVEAAFMAYCSDARVIDAAKVGDWLLHHEHTTIEELAALAHAQPWRDGAAETSWILEHLNGRSRSLPESEMRVVLGFAGLPVPEVNRPVDRTGRMPYLPDLYYRRYGVAVEYEGGQHQADRGVYVSDLGRYADLRRAGVRYVQVTKETLGRPRSLVGEVYRELLAGGYDGPPPVLAEG